jgi:hypothetical protein
MAVLFLLAGGEAQGEQGGRMKAEG